MLSGATDRGQEGRQSAGLGGRRWPSPGEQHSRWRPGGVWGRGRGDSLGDHPNMQRPDGKAPQAVAQTLPNPCPVFLKTAEVVRNKESLGNWHRREGVRAT